MKNSKVVFENQSGRTVRTIQWTAEKMIAIYRIDTRRLEFVDSTEILEADKIPFTTIKEIHRNDLNGRRIPVSHVGYLRIVNQDEMPPVREDVQVLPEDTERFPVYLKKTAVAHVAMVLIFLLS